MPRWGMRITEVTSTELFTGTRERPLQIIRVTLVNDGPGMIRDPSAVVTVSAHGPGVRTPEPAEVGGLVHGEQRIAEVAVDIAASAVPGGTRQVTVIAQSSAGRWEGPGQITVAEPGWTMFMVSHFHYDPVWWNTQGRFAQTWPLLPADDGSMPEVRTVFELVRLHLAEARSDPDYKFVLAEIDYLKPYFDVHPQDRAELRALIAAGRVEIVGGSYNEPNTNLTCAESTIRNAVYGLAYQREVAAANPTATWMLDAFGFDPSYPGLMAQAGMKESSWARGPFHQWGPSRAAGGNTMMQFPAEFEWISPDGRGLLTSYMPNHYSAGWITQHAADLVTAEEDAYTQFRQLAPVASTRNVMLPVGGDHVVPSRWATAIHRDWNARYVWPRFVTAVPREYFDAVRAEAAATGAWIMPQTRDMNPIYPGKDVTYIDTKQAQRDAEIALLDGERLGTAAWLAGAHYPRASLDKAWRLMVFGAHHDAITGTEGDQVYLDLLAGWREAFERGHDARKRAIAYLAGLADTASAAARLAGQADAARAAEPVLANITAQGSPARDAAWTDERGLRAEKAAQPEGDGKAGEEAGGTPGNGSLPGVSPRAGRAVLVFNTLAWERPGLAAITLRYEPGEAGWLRLLDGTGQPVPFLAEGVSRHPDGSLASATVTFRSGDVPAVGYRTYIAEVVPAGANGRAGESGWQQAEGLTIANETFRLTADPGSGGALSSIVDVRTGTELLAGHGNELVLAEEYASHPRWGEGPWMLCPTGEWRSSAGLEACVRAERCPIGTRLVSAFTIGDQRFTQESVLWDGADLVDFRTHVDGSIGQDRLLRVRFGLDVAGGLPVYQTGLSVVGRPLGQTDVDVAEHTFTLDNPAHEWFGIGSAVRVALTAGDGERRVRAIGVAEVVAPAGPAGDAFAPRDPLAGRGARKAVRNLLVALARQGITATCSVPQGPRYGSIELDSNLPDVRISIGGRAENAFTEAVLEVADPAIAAEFDRQLATTGAARVWVPGSGTAEQAFGAGADVRGLTDLPVLIVAGNELDDQIAALATDLSDAQIDVRCPPASFGEGPTLASHTVALLNRGLPGSIVTPAGQACISLMRACSAWPSGVWMDGDKRTVPDGSSFALQHWSHTFEYALMAGQGDWRAAGFPVAGQQYSHRLLTCDTDLHAGLLPADFSLASVTPAGTDLMAMKPRGNPLAPVSQPDVRDGVTMRLRRLADTDEPATVRLFTGIAAATVTDVLEQGEGAAADCGDGTVSLAVPAGGTVTLAIDPGDLVDVRHDPRVAGTAGDPGAAGASGVPEPAQPIFTRYWLHGKGPAPAGNLPVAVHLSPGIVTPQPGETTAVRLSVACGPAPVSGTVSLGVPAGLRLMSVRPAGAEPGLVTAAGSALSGPLHYHLKPHGFAAWDLVIAVPPGSGQGRHFVTAMIIDDAGQLLEDAVVVAVGEPQSTHDLTFDELTPLIEAASQAEDSEAELIRLTSHLDLPPGGRGAIVVRLDNHTASELRGEAQLISPHGSWASVGPWNMGFTAAASGAATMTFDVEIPAGARPGQRWWALVKVMYFGRLRYSEPVWVTVRTQEGPAKDGLTPQFL
ncbi:MAG TPA: glycoside hydrolase family 38 C-terminal domain-containing protein [Streptosporangiaceae bacterium]|nr:glycoside hydrolase family 38 C-terminal domain-containing protein [Streptosporangiaceae bacterium]